MDKKYCRHCDAEREPDAKFCHICGSKLETIPTEDSNRKPLTKDIIDKDLRLQKHSFGEYLGQFLLFVLMIVITFLGNPLILICGIFWAINVIRMIRDDIKRKKKSYYILERACIQKQRVEHDDSPDTWQLWFKNQDGQLLVAATVDKAFHDETQLGDVFYIVTLHEDKSPCLCYRKTQWIY